MAYPAVEVDKFRNRVQTTVNSLRDLGEVIAIIDDQGVDDTARAAFFDDVFGEATDNPDITFQEFAAGITALRAMQTAWATNKYAVAKLLR